MSSHRVTLELSGVSAEEGEIRLPDFLAVLEAFSSAIGHADQALNGRRSAYARLIDLRHNSPAAVTIELEPIKRKFPLPGVPFPRELIVDQLLSVSEVSDEIDVERYGRSMLSAFKKMLAPIGKHRVSEAKLSSNGKVVHLTAELHHRLSDLLNPEQSVEGTIDGRLEAINVHSGQNVFTIYPLIGPKRVLCRFPARLEQQAIRALTRRVEVSGALKYREGARFPHAVTVQNLEMMPSNDELPTLMDLRGIAPNATGDLSSEDFVRMLRDEWRSDQGLLG